MGLNDMAVYYVVSADFAGDAPTGMTLLKVSDPLVGTDSISVTSGDTFILSSDLDADLNLNQPAGYDSSNPAIVEIEGGNTTGYTVEATVDGDMNIVVPDGNDASMVNIDGFAIFSPSTALNISIGDGASIGNIRGSLDGDTITTGENATVGSINGSFGDDTITIGQGSTVGSINGSFGNDAITIGQNATIGEINGSFGNDTVAINQNATVNSVSGGSGDDTVTVASGSQVGSISTGIGADSVTIDGGTVTGTVDTGSSDLADDTVNLVNGATVGGDISTGGGADTVSVTDSHVSGQISTGYADVHDDTVVVNNSTVDGDILVGGASIGGSNTVAVMNGSTVGGTVRGGTGVDNFTIQDATVTGNILTEANDDNVVLNNAYIGGYIHQEIGDDSLTLAGTVTIDGVRNSPTGTRFIDASVDQYSGDDTITIMSGAQVTTKGVINQGANSGIGLNEDYLEFNDQGDVDTYRNTLGQAGFWDEDGDGTYTYKYNDNLGDKPLGSATGSEGEFTYTGTSFINVDNTNSGWTCFTRNTMIQTDRGAVAIEDLRVGDLVVTRDNGLQPIRWIGSKALAATSLAEDEALRPIRIRQGALGSGTPSSDLLVSPQHRMLVRSKIAQRMFGTNEVLVAAKQLCQIDGIDIADDAEGVEYFHLLFDRHEIVTANGAESESLYTGPEALKSVGPQALQEIFALFPDLKERDYTPSGARALISGRMGRKLAVRHKQNSRALVERSPRRDH